jgi:hypothetical protein
VWFDDLIDTAHLRKEAEQKKPLQNNDVTSVTCVTSKKMISRWEIIRGDCQHSVSSCFLPEVTLNPASLLDVPPVTSVTSGFNNV